MFAYVGDSNAWVDIFGLSYEEVREVQKGEKILDLIREAKRETFLEGKEYAVIKRKDGKRYLVSGDKGKIILPEDTIIIYGHTHPFNTSINNGLSQGDRLSLDLVNDGKGQSKQYPIRLLFDWIVRWRPLQNSPKSPKFPPRHLGDFS